MVVEIKELTIDGKIIAVGLVLPALESIPIIEVGSSWMLEQLIATSIIIGKVTVDLFGLSFCMLSIALIPSGVAAPFMPSRFADMFIATYCLLSSERLCLPKILFIIGERSLDNFFESPLCSKIENMPIQMAYMAHSSSDSETALFDALSSPESTCEGSKMQMQIMLEANKNIQILFMINYMIKIS